MLKLQFSLEDAISFAALMQDQDEILGGEEVTCMWEEFEEGKHDDALESLGLPSPRSAKGPALAPTPGSRFSMRSERSQVSNLTDQGGDNTFRTARVDDWESAASDYDPGQMTYILKRLSDLSDFYCDGRTTGLPRRAVHRFHRPLSSILGHGEHGKPCGQPRMEAAAGPGVYLTSPVGGPRIINPRGLLPVGAPHAYRVAVKCYKLGPKRFVARHLTPKELLLACDVPASWCERLVDAPLFHLPIPRLLIEGLFMDFLRINEGGKGTLGALPEGGRTRTMEPEVRQGKRRRTRRTVTFGASLTVMSRAAPLDCWELN
jgi:hypothetical protein